MTVPGIDVHAHWYPREILKLIEDEGKPYGAVCSHDHPDGPVVRVNHAPSGAIPPAGPLNPGYIDLDERLARMDAAGVGMHALSFTQPMLYWAGDALGEKLAATFNEAISGAHEAHPERFVGLATLALQNVDRSLKELDRVAKLPGIRGVYMATRIIQQELSHPDFYPVFERIQELGLPVFLHPLNGVGAKRLYPHYHLGNMLSNPFESAIAASFLIYDGLLDRFPDLEFVLPHAGGALPYLIGRINQGYYVREECKHLPRAPIEYLDRFYFDTIAFHDDALKYLIDLVGADRVLMGSDYCFTMGYERPVEVISNHPGLDAAQRQAILGGNAAKLLKLTP